MEILASALAGVAAALAGLTAALWRLQKSNGNGNKHQEDRMKVLNSMDSKLGTIAGAQKELAAALGRVDSGVAVLLDRPRT